MRLCILTYNIHYALGMDGRRDARRIAEVIHQIGPDVVGLNEVHHPFISTEGGRPMLAEIADALGMHCVFGSPHPIVAKIGAAAPYGNALLSRHPLLNPCTYRLPAPEPHDSRGAVSAEIMVSDAVRLNCYVTHLDHLSESLRLQQTDFLLAVLRHSPADILLGDFNAVAPSDYRGQPDKLAELSRGKGAHMTPMQVAPRLLDAGYVDAQATLHECPPSTWSTENPIIRIDYVWLAPRLRSHLRTCARWDSPLARVASDHFPVLAELDIPES
jgi:endonuclease/exonuclease/phosphatase family metal-dependent hydrolase